MENIRYVGSQKGYFISSLEFMSASQKTIVNCLNSQYFFNIILNVLMKTRNLWSRNLQSRNLYPYSNRGSF